MLPDIADLLMACDRSAAVVVDDDGDFLGAITENDILRAYVEGAEWNRTVMASDIIAGTRLQSDLARCPGSLGEAMTVKVSTPLCEAAEKLRALALGDLAFRHLVVRDERDQLRGILSALDLARALCIVGKGMDEIDRRVGATGVTEVMKPRAALPCCPSGGSLGHALRLMIESRQNCVLVTDSDFCTGAQGVITPRDALRAFAEHVPLDVVAGHWLRGMCSPLEKRLVPSNTRLAQAAWVMACHSIHHIVVVSPETKDITGVVSSSDLAQTIGSAERVVLGWAPLGA